MIGDLGSMIVVAQAFEYGGGWGGWVQLAILIVAIIVGYATAPKPKPPKPAAFEDFDFPQFEEGTPQCVIFGDCWTGDWMVLGYGNYRTTPVKTKTGKK